MTWGRVGTWDMILFVLKRMPVNGLKKAVEHTEQIVRRRTTDWFRQRVENTLNADLWLEVDLERLLTGVHVLSDSLHTQADICTDQRMWRKINAVRVETGFRCAGSCGTEVLNKLDDAPRAPLEALSFDFSAKIGAELTRNAPFLVEVNVLD